MLSIGAVDALYIGGILALVALVLWSARRENEIFRVGVSRGRIAVLKGRVPPSFMGDLREIVKEVENGTIRAIKEGGEPRLVVSPSIDERTAQRLRNAFSLYPNTKRL